VTPDGGHGVSRNDGRHYVPTNVQVQVAGDFVDESHDSDVNTEGEVAENGRMSEMRDGDQEEAQGVEGQCEREARIFTEAS
jgi:hypothetical protein